MYRLTTRPTFGVLRRTVIILPCIIRPMGSDGDSAFRLADSSSAGLDGAVGAGASTGSGAASSWGAASSATTVMVWVTADSGAASQETGLGHTIIRVLRSRRAERGIAGPITLRRTAGWAAQPVLGRARGRSTAALLGSRLTVARQDNRLTAVQRDSP